jgi:hypothetical protein
VKSLFKTWITFSGLILGLALFGGCGSGDDHDVTEGSAAPSASPTPTPATPEAKPETKPESKPEAAPNEVKKDGDTKDEKEKDEKEKK